MAISMKLFTRNMENVGSNGTVGVVVTVDVGQRIIRFGFTGKENMFCKSQTTQPVDEPVGGVWKMKGGLGCGTVLKTCPVPIFLTMLLWNGTKVAG